jgi:phosphoserine phosphatase
MLESQYPRMLMLDPLPSWNEGAPKKAIISFVNETTTPDGPKFVAPEDRIAAFDQDGTTWVEQPAYTQVLFAFHQLGVLAAKDPTLREAEPFKTVLAGDPAATARLGIPELLKVITVTHSGMTVDAFQKTVHDWITTAQHPRYGRLYTDLVYLPMLEVIQYLRANDYKVIIVTGGGQDFVRTYVERVYGIPREQVVGSAAGTSFGYDAGGSATLTKDPKLLWINDKSAKPVEIYQAMGRRPIMAFGNSDGDQHMLEYTQDGGGTRFMLLVHHDDAAREYASDATMSVFSDALMAKAKQRGWWVVSMKNDWKRMFAWQS